MKVIAVMNQKGGTGKTTISINVAADLQRKKYRVCLLDTDFVQGSASDWSSINNGKYFDVVTVKPDAIKGYLERNKGIYDFVIIDCPPRANIDAAKIIICAHLILMPIQPSPYDIWASTELCELIKARQEIVKDTDLPKLEAYFILSRAARNSRLVDEAKEALLDTDIPIFKSHTTQFEVFKRAPMTGNTVFDYPEVNGAAINQIKSITREMLEVLENAKANEEK